MPVTVSYAVWVVIVFLTLGLQACKSLDRADLVGDYVAEYSFGTDRLKLRSDGTYLQEIVVRGDPEKALQSGKWEYDSKSRGPVDHGTILLYGCLGLTDGAGAKRGDYRQPSSICSYPVERESILAGRLQLASNEEHPHRRQ